MAADFDEDAHLIAAELLHTTVGAIKEGLKRARHRLRALAANSNGITETKQHNGTIKIQPEREISKEVFEQFLACFRAGVPEPICRTYLALVAKGIHIEKITGPAGSYYFAFRDPNGHFIGIFQEA